MSKRIKKLIKKTRHRLTWRVAEIRGAGVDTLMITSDYQCRTHTIHVPDHNVRDIEYLHELAHATLCETVHPMFSTQYFMLGTDQRYIELITPAAQAASDWFADAWLLQVAPDEERAEIDEHRRLVCRLLQEKGAGDAEMLYGAALMIAQGIKYCGSKIRCDGQLEQAVNAFLAVDPACPSVKILGEVLNSLLHILYSFDVSLMCEDGLDVWRVAEL